MIKRPGPDVAPDPHPSQDSHLLASNSPADALPTLAQIGNRTTRCADSYGPREFTQTFCLLPYHDWKRNSYRVGLEPKRDPLPRPMHRSHPAKAVRPIRQKASHADRACPCYKLRVRARPFGGIRARLRLWCAEAAVSRAVSPSWVSTLMLPSLDCNSGDWAAATAARAVTAKTRNMLKKSGGTNHQNQMVEHDKWLY